MHCLYQNCKHNPFKDTCSFRPFPSNDCQFRIWKRYARCSQFDVKRSNIPSLCSCHFINGNENPIPHYELQSLKRKQSTNEYANEGVNERVYESLNPESKYHKTNRDKQKECRKVIIYEDLESKNPNEIILSFEVKAETVEEVPIFEIEEISDSTSASDHLTVRNRSNQFKSKTTRDNTSFEGILQPQDEIDTMDDVICTTDLIDIEIIEIKDDPVHPPPKVNPSFGFEMIQNSDEQFFTYTGLPSKAMFDSVFDTLCQLEFNYVCGWTVNKIPMKNQLLMTLMKLRLDLRHNEVAERFKCSEATVSNIVRSWIVQMEDIIFLHEMKDIPSVQRKNEELKACRIVEQMVRNELENAMKYKH